MQGQAWNIKINNVYLIGHNEGTFVYENALFKINIKMGLELTKSSINNSYFAG
jgi:hypothetical protein